jgi:hypothetical protein
VDYYLQWSDTKSHTNIRGSPLEYLLTQTQPYYPQWSDTRPTNPRGSPLEHLQTPTQHYYPQWSDTRRIPPGSDLRLSEGGVMMSLRACFAAKLRALRPLSPLLECAYVCVCVMI